jgi:5-methylcytosine-specific restriction endonuclease McrA
VCEIREKCNGDATEEVDHIIPIDDGGARLDEENLQAACRPCHRWKTIHIDQQGQRMIER